MKSEYSGVGGLRAARWCTGTPGRSQRKKACEVGVFGRVWPEALAVRRAENEREADPLAKRVVGVRPASGFFGGSFPGRLVGAPLKLSAPGSP